MAKEKILIVDDEEDILELVKFNLTKEGYKTMLATTGEQALDIVKNNRIDLIVLDLMLPGVDGLEVTRIIRNNPETQTIPIIMLTAKGDESDIITGLELGANDYISKPFSLKELIARIRNIFRRRQKLLETRSKKIITEQGLTIDYNRHLVTLENDIIDLTPSEFQLLSMLVQKKGWVFTRGQLIDAIHGENYAVTERSIDVVVVGLRKKLGTFGTNIKTVRGIGYKFQDNKQDNKNV
ncbi:MAG: response regulator transcription factor [Desulfobacteraceae bacterium]|nr:response regulator transcription factor [Desulfobacteraceae bacterium]